MKLLIFIIFLFLASESAYAEDAQAWYDRAVSAREEGRLQDAAEALAKAEELEFLPLRIALERARQYVASNDKAAAIAELRTLADAGFASVATLTNDPVLGTLQGTTDFDALLAEMSVAAYPCEHDNVFAEFDFWVGRWDVHDGGGNFAGNNVIEKRERGCVLTEHWTSARGSTGSSINYLDKTTGEWVQIWNDQGGSQIHIRGGLRPDGMRLAGTIHYVSNGTTAPFRALWTPLPDGRVRQFFEQSNDDGETWSTWFEGFYTRQTEN